MRRARAENLRRLPGLAAVLTVTVLTGPMWWRGGYGLARDMVFTPHYPANADAIGMGSVLPRAVPLDGVLAVLTSFLDGAVVFRLAVAGVLLLAVCGAHRCVSGLPPTARMLAVVVALWNPYVVERLALGQWALLAAYAAMWWLLPALRAALHREPGGVWRVMLWTWIGSLTPTGGVVVLLLVLSTCLVHRRRAWVSARVIAVAVAGQLPWLLPSLLAGSAAVSDPSGVGAFASRAERPGGAVLTLLGTGGVWSPFVTPSSLGSALGHLLTGAVVLVLALSARWAWREQPGLVVAAATGFLVAALPHLPLGTEAMRWAVEHVPGAGILRDSQKWLMPYVLVVVIASARTAAGARAWLAARDQDLGALVAGVLVLVPVALMPDAPARTWQALRPVHLPSDLAAAVTVLDDADAGTGAAVTLPWDSYRRFTWGNPVSAADPLPRWTRHDVVVSDVLSTPQGTVAGEDTRARGVAQALASGRLTAARPQLARHGIGWVLVYRDQPTAAGLDLSGMEPVLAGPEVALYRVPGAVAPQPPRHRALTVASVAALDAAWLLAGAAALLVAGRTSLRGRVRGRHAERRCAAL